VASIMAKAGPDMRWETRRNALEVLRKISKSIMLCEELVIRRELMKDGVQLGDISSSMLQLATGMTAEERGRYKEEGLAEKLADLQHHCDWETEMVSILI
jgi:hypothetical protein